MPRNWSSSAGDKNFPEPLRGADLSGQSFARCGPPQMKQPLLDELESEATISSEGGRGFLSLFGELHGFCSLFLFQPAFPVALHRLPHERRPAGGASDVAESSQAAIASEDQVNQWELSSWYIHHPSCILVVPWAHCLLNPVVVERSHQLLIPQSSQSISDLFIFQLVSCRGQDVTPLFFSEGSRRKQSPASEDLCDEGILRPKR